MSKLEKLLQRIKNNPKTVRFEELDKILRREGYDTSQPRGGSSHYTYRKPGVRSLTIPRQTPYVGEIYVRVVLTALGI
ncbi:MAG: toxin HicA [Selenomonadaceae bacterium]|nr:toxin HicA [Selenomonadaceae bacterium]